MKLTIINKENFNQIQNTIMNICIKLKVQNVFISIIGDNEFKNKKLRNYKRHELLLVHINKSIINFNLNHYSGLLDNDKFSLKLFLESVVVNNQASKYGKYSNVFKNISLPICYLESEIIDYKNSSMSKINKFNLNMGKLKLSIDPNFIKEIINFGENILYRMEILNFNVDEIFLHRDADNKIRKQIENYQKENSIYYGTNFSFPEIDLNFELNEVGLNELLREKFNTPQYLVWLGNGLVNREHNIYIKNPNLISHFGSLKNLIEKIILMYKDQASSEINAIGFKGLLGQIGNFFIYSNKTSKKCTDVQKGRMRPPRAFYGKYKYFKKYNSNDAKYLELLENKFNLEKNGIYLSDFILGKKYLFAFTNYHLVVLETNTLKEYINVDYTFIDRADCDKNYVLIYLNAKGKNQKKTEQLPLNCDTDSNAEIISQILNENCKNNSK